MNSTISVLMCAYNEKDYIAKAVNSILNQTYKAREIIIVDDASTDGTTEILEDFAKKYKQIKLLKNYKNIGLTKSLNIGLAYSTCQYVARMDANDIALASRFDKQIQFLENNPDHAVVGTWREEFWEDGTPNRKIKLPITNKELQCALVKGSSIGHSTVMVRGGILRRLKYNEKFLTSQDNELWGRIGKNYKLANIPEYLTLILRQKNSVTANAPVLRTLKYQLLIRYQAYKNLDCPKWYIIFLFKPFLEAFIPTKLIQMYINMKKTTNKND